jgi:hypothetical protein
VVDGRMALCTKWRGSFSLLAAIMKIAVHMVGLEERMKGPRYDVFGPWPACLCRTSWHSFLKLHSLNLGARARAGVIIFTPSSARCDTRLQALDGPSHATEPTRVRCVRHDTARPRDSWPVSPLCVSVACGCVSLALLTFLQPRMRNHTCANRRSVVAARNETPVCHTSHRRRLSRECARPGARRPTPRCAPRGPSPAVRLCSTR